MFRRPFAPLLFLLLAALLMGSGCSDDAPPAVDAALPPADRGPGAEVGPPDGGPDGPGPTLEAGTDQTVTRDGTPLPACVLARGSATPGGDTLSFGGDTATLTVTGAPGCARSFSLKTTATLRDNLPANPRAFAEKSGWPSLQSGHALFDALYALALEDLRQNSVSSIKNGAFNGGNPIACPSGGCFETGRKWTYVWTRDTAYAVDLGLAELDPTRAKNSLAFKLSTRRDGSEPQIVQDTGSGGSYPVSSDRVVWALGAMETLHFLSGAARGAFAASAYEAMANTAEHDRKVVYDPKDGLYRGETSFLDWREQTYPAYTQSDTAKIAASKALSTNMGHLALLDALATLGAELGKAKASTYAAWRDALRAAVRKAFYLAESKLFSSFIPGPLDPAPVRRYDLLGAALAVLLDGADAAQARAMVAAYPHLPAGPPVIWPQQQGVPIYHNRGIWPFVTAYWALAAAKVRNDAAVGAALDSLVRGAALNLSNMENLEAETGQAYRADGSNSGPVVNSQRQLWSVAGYVALVHRVLFGLRADKAGLRFAPYLPRKVRASFFSGAETLVLNNFPYRGKTITVVLELPKAAGTGAGAYAVGPQTLNGAPLAAGAAIDEAKLAPRNLLTIKLLDTAEAGASITLVSTAGSDGRSYYGPRTPTLGQVQESGGKLQLSLGASGETPAEITFSVYRDGVRVAQGLPGSTTTWTDPQSAGSASPSYCYALEAVYKSSQNASQRSAPVCYWGPAYGRARSVWASSFTATGGKYVNNHGKYHYESWGDAGHKLVVSGFKPDKSGAHYLQVEAGNGAGPVSTGVTCGVKRIEVREGSGAGTLVGSGYLVMPHLPSWSSWADSTLVPVTLSAGKSYQITILSHPTAMNMSELGHFSSYSGKGGSSGPFNRVNISQLKVLSLQ